VLYWSGAILERWEQAIRRRQRQRTSLRVESCLTVLLSFSFPNSREINARSKSQLLVFSIDGGNPESNELLLKEKMLILGINRSAFVAVHAFIGIVAIFMGFVVLFGLLNGKLSRPWNAVFLLTTLLTSASGLLFSSTKVTPGIVLGIVSLIILGIAIIALYGFHLQGLWRTSYVLSSMVPFYFNLAILFAIGFVRIPTLRQLASATDGTAFKIAEALLLVLATSVIAIAVRKFRLNPHPVWSIVRVEATRGTAEWIVLNSNYIRVNVHAESTEKESVLSYYRQLIRIRKSKRVLIFGTYRDISGPSPMSMPTYAPITPVGSLSY
jgi:hypothetical protein